MTTESDTADFCLASTEPSEFEANIMAMATMNCGDAGVIVEDGVLEAQSFADMLKVSIAQLEGKTAMRRAALKQVQVALDAIAGVTYMRD